MRSGTRRTLGALYVAATFLSWPVTFSCEMNKIYGRNRDYQQIAVMDRGTGVGSAAVKGLMVTTGMLIGGGVYLLWRSARPREEDRRL